METCMDVDRLYQQDPKLKKTDVEMLGIWSKQQRHFPRVEELQVALALHACFYSLEQAKSCLDNYLTIRGMCPQLFANGNPDKDPALKMAMSVNGFAILPDKTKEGYTVLLARLIDPNPDRYNPQVASKVFDMLLLRHIHLKGPGNGLVVIFDMKGGVFGHLTKINLGEYKTFLIYLQTAMPIRLMAVHFINVVPFMDKIMAIIRPFISKDMFLKLIIHANNDNLYKYIPKEILPEEYGGRAQSEHLLFEKCKQLIYDSLAFFEFQDTMITDESKRIGPRKNAESLFGFDGSFRKLAVD